jgi:hypothetical protein
LKEKRVCEVKRWRVEFEISIGEGKLGARVFGAPGEFETF